MAYQKPQNIARGIAPRSEVKEPGKPHLAGQLGYEVRLRSPVPMFGGMSQFNSKLDPSVQIKLSVEFRAFTITKGDETFFIPLENVTFWKTLKV